jgi:hypothetical protein
MGGVGFSQVTSQSDNLKKTLSYEHKITHCDFSSMTHCKNSKSSDVVSKNSIEFPSLTHGHDVPSPI